VTARNEWDGARCILVVDDKMPGLEGSERAYGMWGDAGRTAGGGGGGGGGWLGLWVVGG